MKQHKKRKAIPDQLLAIRKGNREAEREILEMASMFVRE